MGCSLLFARNKAKLFNMAFLIFFCISGMGQRTVTNQISATIDLSDFSDGSHHWYDIKDNDAVITPRPGHPRYGATEIAAIANNILLYQKDNGGWPKNYDMQAILGPGQADSLLKAKPVLNTTYDNGTTYSQIVYLARANAIVPDEKYRTAVLKGLEFVLASQYSNGGWPQYYPLEENYSRHITFNDDAFTGIMWLLKDISSQKPEYAFIGKKLRGQLQKAFENGLTCILKTQINDAGQSTAWCQQYDEITLQPAWARKFEPPSICNGESVEIVLLLMSIKDPSKAIIDAVQHAIAWFRVSAIRGVRIETFAAPEMITPYRISRTDKRVLYDSMAPPIWTRYYELVTHRPLFCNRDSKVVYSFAEVDRERRDGYGWYTYAPKKAFEQYRIWQKKWAPGKNMLE